jgi:hypothetical protein
MNVLRMFAAGLVLAVSALGVQEALAESSVAIPDGSITFAQNPDGSGATCGFAFTHKQDGYNFHKGESGCQYDKYNYFRLENVPSASSFKLWAKACDRADEKSWEYDLKTYINPTTTGWLYISALRAASEGAIFARGVILVTKKYSEVGDGIDELSCVWITRSSLP